MQEKYGKLRYIFSFLFIMAVQVNLSAQHNHQERLYYFGQKSLSEKSTLLLAAGWHIMPADKWNRYELRTSHLYTIKHWLQLEYGQQSNFAFKKGSFLNYELRPYQTVNLFHEIFRYSRMTHRFKLEERIFFNYEDINTFQCRLRYRLELKVPIKIIESLYFRPMTEFFYTMKGADNRSLTQWKSTLALGYSLNKKLSLEVRYEYILNGSTVGSIIDELNGFRIQFVHKF